MNLGSTIPKQLRKTLKHLRQNFDSTIASTPLIQRSTARKFKHRYMSSRSCESPWCILIVWVTKLVLPLLHTTTLSCVFSLSDCLNVLPGIEFHWSKACLWSSWAWHLSESVEWLQQLPFRLWANWQWEGEPIVLALCVQSCVCSSCHYLVWLLALHYLYHIKVMVESFSFSFAPFFYFLLSSKRFRIYLSLSYSTF